MKKLLSTIVAMLVMTIAVYASATTDLNSGVEKYNAKDYENAVVDLTKAIKENSHLTDAYNYRGKSYIELRKIEEAIKDFDQVIKLAPHSADGYTGRAAAYATDAKWDKALPDLNKSIEINPNDWQTYTARAMVQYELKDKDAAYADLDKALKVEERGEIYGARSIMELADLKFGEAYSDYKKSQKLIKKQEKAKNKK